MTVKLKGPASSLSKFEKEIEKLRNENKWMRLRDFAATNKDQKLGKLTTKQGSYLVRFVINISIFSRGFFKILHC